MVPAGTRRADRGLRPPGHPRRTGLACLTAGLLTALSCATQRAPAEGPHGGDPRPLQPEDGTTVTGRLRPGETVVYALPLEEGQYLEIHLDRDPDEVKGYLYGPGVQPTGSEAAACSWTELAPDVDGQVLWELAQTSGTHRLQLRPKGDEPVPYTVTIAALRPGTSRDRARQRCDESFSAAESLRRKGSLEQAVERFGATLELCREGEYARGAGSTLSFRGRALQSLGEHDLARRDLEAALEIWTKIRERYSMAGTLIRLAALERRLANWDRADELLEEGLHLARGAGFRDVEANGLEAYCRIQIEKGDTQRAIESCGKAVDLWKTLDRPSEEVEALNNLGLIYLGLGQLDAARAYFLRGMDVLVRHPQVDREATLRNNLAILFEAEGELQRALEEYQKAAKAQERLGHYSSAGVSLQNMGEIYRQLDKLDAALDYFEQALALMERAQDPLGRIQVLHSLGDLYQDLGELPRARQILSEALDLSRRSHAAPYLAGSLSRVGALRLREGRPREARSLLQEALELSREIGNRWTETDILVDLGEAYARLGDDERALEILFEALTISTEIGDRTGTAQSQYRIARIERNRGNLETARSAAEETLAVVDEIGTVMGSSELRSLFTAASRPYHELYIDILMTQHERKPGVGHDVEALRASERARAQSLLEILVEADLGPGPEVPEYLLEKRTILLRDLNNKELQRQNLLADEEADPAALIRVKLDLEELLHDLRDVERRMRAESPRYAALTYPEAVSTGEIQRTILDYETALLEYSLGEERSFLWAVTHDDFRTYELPGRDAIDPAARCLHWLIRAFGRPPAPELLPREKLPCLGDHLDPYQDLPPGSHPLQARAHRKRLIANAFDEIAGHLSEILFGGPSRDDLLPFRLVIVSDGALEYVPFGSLPEPGGSGQPLMRSHEVVRQPSVSILAFQRRQLPSVEEPSGELAVVADPVYAPGDARISKSSRSRRIDPRADPGVDQDRFARSFTRLPFAGEEADLITRFVSDDARFIARGLAASRETVLGGALSGYRYVHFATHGTIDTRFPELSSLVLSLVDDKGRAHDHGYLRLNDIYGLKLDATDMVVLSACETALGREVRGEGLVGLTRGFLYAGAERVVASLWQVQDRATARLMEHLYRGLLQEGKPPADALRHAQLAVLDEPGGSLAFPYYWAGFVLQGEWR